MHLADASSEQLKAFAESLEKQYSELKAENLNLDLTRGKPSSDQLDLSNGLDSILAGDFSNQSNTDVRNYGGLDGLPEAKALFAQMIDCPAEDVVIGGNASLSLMYFSVMFALHVGFGELGAPWAAKGEKIKFICPVPGYDRHFSICEQFNIEMIPVAMNNDGPDMDEVERLIAADASIRGIWCVPRFSNPSGIVYSEATVSRIAKLANIAGENFRVFWDNAYAVHSIDENAAALSSISAAAKAAGTEDSIYQFGSTSKITFAGAGVAFVAMSAANRKAFTKAMGIFTIGPDKVNQLRHVRFLKDLDGINALMKKHAALLKPRFDIVLDSLARELQDSTQESSSNAGEYGEWTAPEGGYFISFDSQPGLAKTIVGMASELGVKLTPAGATFPYGNDPKDQNIRIAPSVPSLDEISKAMEVFVCCVKLATVRQKLTS